MLKNRQAAILAAIAFGCCALFLSFENSVEAQEGYIVDGNGNVSTVELLNATPATFNIGGSATAFPADKMTIGAENVTVHPIGKTIPGTELSTDPGEMLLGAEDYTAGPDVWLWRATDGNAYELSSMPVRGITIDGKEVTINLLHALVPLIEARRY